MYYDLIGQNIRYKMYWAIKKFHSVKNIDYDGTFVCVIKLIIWKSLLDLKDKFDYKIEQLDINTAFLEPFIKENEYMEPSNRFHDSKGISYSWICYLKQRFNA